MLVIMPFGEPPTRNEQVLTGLLENTLENTIEDAESLRTSASFTDPLIRSISSSSSRSYRTSPPHTSSLPISLINTCSSSGTSSCGMT